MKVRARDLGPVYDVFVRREYDFTVVDWSRVKTVIDCGANVGAFTAWVMARCDAQVFAVEPAPTATATLRSFAAAHRARVRTMQVAVGTERGEMAFYESLGGTSSLVPWRSGWDPNIRTSVATVVTLDDVFIASGFDAVDLLKIDIEGGEVGVFASEAAELLKRVGFLLMEVHTSFGASSDEVVAAAQGAGLEVAVEVGERTAFVVGWRY